MRISDWSSDVCSSDLSARGARPLSRHDHARGGRLPRLAQGPAAIRKPPPRRPAAGGERHGRGCAPPDPHAVQGHGADGAASRHLHPPAKARSEEHTSELQSLMRISYAVFCLKKKTKTTQNSK